MANTVKAMREAEVKEIVEQLGGTLLQFIPEGRCGVRYARGGLDVPCTVCSSCVVLVDFVFDAISCDTQLSYQLDKP